MEIAPDPANDTITVAAHDRGFTLASPRDSTVYDAAGNATRIRSRRGLWTTLVYDAMNRVTFRTTDSVTYAVAVDTVLIPNTTYTRDIWTFPRFSIGADGTLSDTLVHAPLRIAGDVATFTFDGMGNVLTADNGDAKVHRQYYPNGRLKVDSLYIRNLVGGTFGHAYGITHTYDLEGRLVTTGTPAQFAAVDPTWATHAYSYQAQTGALSAVSQGATPVAGFTYDDEGRLVLYGDGDVHTQGYDADGRMQWQARTYALGALAQRDTFTYDVRGKRIRVRSLADSTVNVFNGMGALAWSYNKKLNQLDSSEEAYAPDPLANNYTTLHTVHSDKVDLVTYEDTRPVYQHGTGRLVHEGRFTTPQATGIRVPSNYTDSWYDAAGNRVKFTQWRHTTNPGMLDNGDAQLQERTYSYFGADEKLRVMDRRTCMYGRIATGQSWWAGTVAGYTCAPPDYSDRPTWEEYRYDALGRRVLTRTDQVGWACYNRCIRGVTRTVWDGDQVLAEVRAPQTYPEQDVGRVPEGSTDHPHGYGQVLYTNGPSLDHPIRVTRLSYDSVFAAPVWITPETNWQGSYDSGWVYNSADGNDCKRIPSGAYDNEKTGDPLSGNGGEWGTGPVYSTPPDSITVCVQVDWPAPYQWKSKLEHGRGRIGPYAWMGSLIEGGRDLTGQLYMRNRFYDPASGRFTQEDPIGIAGGLNVYGFGKGDPITYSDPYGLAAEVCPPCDGNPKPGVFTAPEPSIESPPAYADPVLLVSGAAAEKLVATPALSALPAVGTLLRNGRILVQAAAILGSAGMAELRAAAEAGTSASVQIGGRIITYDPAPFSGLTNFAEGTFHLGKEAFASTPELTKTVLHELYRLTYQTGGTASQAQAVASTNAAAGFATSAYNFGKHIGLW